MKAIVLARVSTEEQKEAGNSLPAQQARLERYCTQKGFEIVKVFSFDESAYKTKRIEFSEVIKEVQKYQEKIVFCCDKIDRLTRNVFDQNVGILEELRKKGLIELHFVSDNVVLHQDSPATDLFRFTIGTSLAKYFSDAIRDNVKRALEQKIRMGEWIGRACYGYKNITDEAGKKTIVVDEFTSRIVVKVYEWYATGAFSFSLIRAKLKTDYNVNFSQGYLDKILKDPFYYGMMRIKGTLYPHKYTQLISKELYDQVQAIKANHNKKPFKYAGKLYVYRGLIRCAHCGLAITPEKHKGHVYYHCTQHNGKHGAEWLREEELTKQLAGVFLRMKVPDDVVNDIINNLKVVHEGKVEFRAEQMAELTKERELYAKRTERIYLDRLDGRITEQVYDSFYTQFREKIADLDGRIALLQQAEDKYYITATYLLELANRAHELFLSSEIEEKRQLIKLTLQNLRLEGKTLRYDAIKPFNTILNFSDCQTWYPVPDSNRRFSG